MKLALKRRIALGPLSTCDSGANVGPPVAAEEVKAADAALLLDVSAKLGNKIVACGSPRRRKVRHVFLPRAADSPKKTPPPMRLKRKERCTPTTTKGFACSPWNDEVDHIKPEAFKRLKSSAPIEKSASVNLLSSLCSGYENVTPNPTLQAKINAVSEAKTHYLNAAKRRRVRSPTESILGNTRVPERLYSMLAASSSLQECFNVMISEIPAVRSCIEDLYRGFWMDLFPLLQKYGWRRAESDNSIDGYTFINTRDETVVASVLELVEFVHTRIMHPKQIAGEIVGLTGDGLMYALESRRQCTCIASTILHKRQVLGRFTHMLLNHLGML